MAYDYAIVHLKYTIPLAGLLTFISRPLLTKLDLYKTYTLIFIAFFATLPWDSYLVRHGIWTYPPDAIVGLRLFSVPAEELFFFVIQTYITSMLYTLLNKPILHAQFLTNKNDSSTKSRWIKILGQILLVGSIVGGAYLVKRGGEGTYLGLILIWACPFALFTWSLSGYFIIRLPLVNVATPIIIPTVYLWVVDELALGRGTWSIESGTKLGWCVWGSLELEEAIFFLATNALVVFGMVAFDRALAVLYTFSNLFPDVPNLSPLGLLAKAVLLDPATYDMTRVKGIREAIETLRRKSRSFYLASSTFPGRLRIDLILLYSFCRVADDLVDESSTQGGAHSWISQFSKYLDLVYAPSSDGQSPSTHHASVYVESTFPEEAWSALEFLPVKFLPRQPFTELLQGFKTDLAFRWTYPEKRNIRFPIKDEADLELYAQCVASSVGELCLRLVFHHSETELSSRSKSELINAARTMGHALQYVNIARDIAIDAEMGRVYLPSNWLKEEIITPEDILRDPNQPKVENLRQRLLELAFKEYDQSRKVMNLLPHEVRAPMIIAVESYMEIGRVLREGKGAGVQIQRGRATVPLWRRLWVVWRTLLAEK
ncbi:Squalene/phytoene synthase-domain-containing protein [Annulohypoxylon maeteangense]|uniref:Squalene/phytoene synthase-domain-containing protein n=1 Tax=Annulohypoxylon maeteangense TaxID=1927788 RepID=UPI0020073729|nr:Squalene/phytoene synthase-domain-containing protein [Annulohypoxylon maeteangense]KAI0885980.1 Squalene/phytoene synthase-domain-containing protein [Annulohypoxylon maeteangense]